MQEIGPHWSDCAAMPSRRFAGILRLDLSRGGIESLLAGDFAGLTSLEYLFLGRNQLTTLPAGVFAGLTGLQRC